MFATKVTLIIYEFQMWVFSKGLCPLGAFLGWNLNFICFSDPVYSSKNNLYAL